MSLRDFRIRSRISWREFFPALILVVNSFSWYSVMSLVFADVVNNLHISVSGIFGLFGAFYVGIAVSAIVIHLLFRQTGSSFRYSYPKGMRSATCERCLRELRQPPTWSPG